MVSLGSNLLPAVAENTAFVIGVMKFCTVWADASANAHKQFCSDQHAHSRSKEIEPKGMPVAASKCRPKGPRGIHAHSGERCFKRDEDRIKCADKIGCVARE